MTNFKEFEFKKIVDVVYYNHLSEMTNVKLGVELHNDGIKVTTISGTTPRFKELAMILLRVEEFRDAVIFYATSERNDNFRVVKDTLEDYSDTYIERVSSYDGFTYINKVSSIKITDYQVYDIPFIYFGDFIEIIDYRLRNLFKTTLINMNNISTECLSKIYLEEFGVREITISPCYSFTDNNWKNKFNLDYEDNSINIIPEEKPDGECNDEIPEKIEDECESDHIEYQNSIHEESIYQEFDKIVDVKYNSQDADKSCTLGIKLKRNLENNEYQLSIITIDGLTPDPTKLLFILLNIRKFRKAVYLYINKPFKTNKGVVNFYRYSDKVSIDLHKSSQKGEYNDKSNVINIKLYKYNSECYDINDINIEDFINMINVAFPEVLRDTYDLNLQYSNKSSRFAISVLFGIKYLDIRDYTKEDYSF